MAYDSLEEKVERLEAIIEIQNLVGKYQIVHIPGPTLLKTLELFALKTPGVSAEISNWGYFEGADQVRALYEKGHGDTTKEHPGMMFEHDMTTPIIEVAKDGKTSMGIWFSPGLATMPDSSGKLLAQWRWGKYAAAFAKEDGKWKIWKWHWYGTFFADYYKSWVDYQPTQRPPIKELNPKTTLYHNEYSPTGIREPIPPAPEPYETWNKPADWRP
ncbi:nuclear transport factor 2 family protein [Chloroflexota bacterium]